MVLVLTIGGAIGLYSTFATLLEQFLCPFGYTDVSTWQLTVIVVLVILQWCML